MRTFYIYHVPGWKVGATTNYKKREKYNFSKYTVEPYIIDELELPDTTETWQIVGDLEFEYADEFGYDRGTHYAEIRKRKRLTRADCIVGGRVAGKLGGNPACGIATSKIKVKCPYCDKVSTPGGIGIHVKYKH